MMGLCHAGLDWKRDIVTNQTEGIGLWVFMFMWHYGMGGTKLDTGLCK